MSDNHSAGTPRYCSVLDERSAQIPIAGKIRAGIKVLTATASKNPRVVDIFNSGIRNGERYSVIERKIADASGIKNPLTPRNTAHFRIQRQDFRFPEVGDLIMQIHGEEDGATGERVLKRFPVIFAFDDWMKNMPHGLRSYTKSGLQYWSEYDAAGDRFCYHHEQVDIDPRAKRAPRQFGGRRLVPRPENGGRCIPDQCQEYQAGQCKVSGRLYFYIPGIPGSSLIALDTTSIYSLSQIRSQMQLVSGLLGGRLSGTIGGKPFFYLTKVDATVSMLDDKGNAVPRRQFLINLESDLRMDELMSSNPIQQLAYQRQAPIAAIENHASEILEAVVEPEAAPPAPAPPPDAPPGDDTPRFAINRLRKELAAELARRGMDAEAFASEQVKEYGTLWSRTLEPLTAVLDQLRSRP